MKNFFSRKRKTKEISGKATSFLGGKYIYNNSCKQKDCLKISKQTFD